MKHLKEQFRNFICKAIPGLSIALVVMIIAVFLLKMELTVDGILFVLLIWIPTVFIMVFGHLCVAWHGY